MSFFLLMRLRKQRIWIECWDKVPELRPVSRSSLDFALGMNNKLEK